MTGDISGIHCWSQEYGSVKHTFDILQGLYKGKRVKKITLKESDAKETEVVQYDALYHEIIFGQDFRTS